MEHEGLYVSKKDVRRYELLQKVVDGRLTLSQVREALGVSYRQAIGVIRDFDRLVAQGTVEEKRTLIRAFLRVLEFDPTARKGIAHFWVVPSVGQDEFFAGPPRRGRRNPPPATDSGAEASGSPQERTSSDGSEVSDTRCQYEGHTANDGMSSLDMVAGAGYVALEKTRAMRWMCELPFEARGRVLDALWEEAKLRLIRVGSGKEPL